MRKTFISVFAVVLLSSAIIQVFAQEERSSQKTPATTEQPKSAVDKLIEEARERGELVMRTCLQDCEASGTEITDGVEAGHALELPQPVYPPIALAARASGEVRVKVLIGTDGTVIAASAISGHPLLQAASVTAARDARFTPLKYKGEPVKVTGVITYNFVSQ